MLFLNILALLAPTQSADNLFHLFTVLCEKFLISILHCFFANVTPCPLVLLSSLTEKKYLSIFSYPLYLMIVVSYSLWPSVCNGHNCGVLVQLFPSLTFAPTYIFQLLVNGRCFLAFPFLLP